MTRVGWLADASEDSLRSALVASAPDLARLPMRIKPRDASSDPLWWSSSAVVDEAVVVKFAWSEVRAVRLWREGVVLERHRRADPTLPLPEVVVLAEQPALVATRIVRGVPLGGEWAWELAGADADWVGRQLAAFLARLHDLDVDRILAGLPVVVPSPQADTARLRHRFPALVDHERGRSVLGWCDWVDGVLARGTAPPPVMVHGDLHGHNQVWDRATSVLSAVVDFEESGSADPHFDFRYLPGTTRRLDLLLATMGAYQQLSGRPLAIDRVMAWNVLTVLGDALWRTVAGVALPGGGSAASWVDDLASRLRVLELP